MTFHRLTRATRALAVTALLVPAAVACGGTDGADAPAAPSATTAPAAPADGRGTDPPQESTTPSAPTATESSTPFDPESVPVSDAPLGDFPYFSVPEGFENSETPSPIVPSGRVPFWTGDGLEWVEGKVYRSSIQAAGGKEFSAPELLAAVESAVTGSGGVRLTDSRIPADVTDSIPRDVRVEYVDGFGDIYNNPVRTYVIRRPDRLIWIHLCSDSAGAGWLMAETTG
ncbi:hypothetical protein ACFW2Y_18095 [Streptomyces sp. NPDC058877]|uniref:hypothetical protein n=1 Tax=Streptomyces sp. NPDC058877 TaxID=3346665 RepID=UPI0036CD9262